MYEPHTYPTYLKYLRSTIINKKNKHSPCIGRHPYASENLKNMFQNCLKCHFFQLSKLEKSTYEIKYFLLNAF